jgi:endoplasmic reticulum resident protein 44
MGQISNYEELYKWAQDKCVPLVREITFENAEVSSYLSYFLSFHFSYFQELTEEGLPFLILFHHPDDSDTPGAFRDIVARELIGEKSENLLFGLCNVHVSFVICEQAL